MSIKKICLVFFVSLSACTTLQAQSPLINRYNEYSIGDSTLLYRITGGAVSGFTQGSSGANIFWDFSAMDFTDASLVVDTLFYIDPTGTPFYPITLSADYSQSNLCKLRLTHPFDPSNKQYSYYHSTNDSLSLIGFAEDNSASEHWEDHCTDYIKQLAFPVIYQSSFVDNYERYFYDMSGSDGHYITGTNTVTADAYGSMKMPDGNIINNILRIHTTLIARDSNALFGIQTFTQHYYRWYSPAKKGFIFSLEMDQTGNQSIAAEYQKQTNITSAKNIELDNSITIYPNPNTGVFTVSSSRQADIIIEVYSPIGQKIPAVIKSIGRNRIVVQMPSDSKGAYLITIRQGMKSVIKKVIVD